MRRAAKVDTNQPKLVTSLRETGVMVFPLKLPVDLLLAWRGVNVLAEVKTPTGTVKLSQIEFMGNWSGYSGIITTWEEGERLAKDPIRHAFSYKQKQRLLAIAVEMKRDGQKTMVWNKLKEKIG